MDRYAARLLLTALMLGAVAVSATLFSDALTQTEGSEPLPAMVQTNRATGQNDRQEQRYFVAAQALTGRKQDMISVLDEEGMSAGNFMTDADGYADIGPLAPGIYYARAFHTDYVRFTLGENAEVSVQEGCGWADGERLYLTEFVPSRLELSCTVPQQQIVTLELVSAEGTSYLQTGYVEDGRTELVFDGLPADTYELCLNGKPLQTVPLDGKTSLCVELP